MCEFELHCLFIYLIFSHYLSFSFLLSKFYLHSFRNYFTISTDRSANAQHCGYQSCTVFDAKWEKKNNNENTECFTLEHRSNFFIWNGIKLCCCYQHSSAIRVFPYLHFAIVSLSILTINIRLHIARPLWPSFSLFSHFSVNFFLCRSAFSFSSHKM